MVATLTDSEAVVIQCPPETIEYDSVIGAWRGMFLPDATETLSPGRAGLTIKFQRDFVPAKAFKDTRTDLSGFALQVVSATALDAKQAYYMEALENVRAKIAQRLKHGISKYDIADRSTEYESLELLYKLEKMYSNLVETYNTNSEPKQPLQVRFFD